MIRIRKEITLSRLEKLWDEIYSGDLISRIGNAIAKDITDEWYYEISNRFYGAKSRGSIIDIGIADMSAWIEIASRNYNSGGKVVLPKKWYASRRYVRDYPFTYVKTGDLKKMMRSRGQFSSSVNPGSSFVSVRVDIPHAKDPDKPIDVYQYLEGSRSFVKSSFILAWPTILEAVLERIE